MLFSTRPMLVCAALILGLGSVGYCDAGEARVRPDQVAHTLSLRSAAAIIQDEETGEILYGKNASTVTPIASITKLMTAQVLLDAQLPMEETVRITEEDRDTERNSRSRLRVGAELSRRDLLQLALMAPGKH